MAIVPEIFFTQIHYDFDVAKKRESFTVLHP